MKKQSKITDVYTPNKSVTVTVNNKREEDLESGSVHYDRTVTIKIKAGKFAKEKLVFDQEDGIAKFIETIDFEDPQTSLLGDQVETPGL